MGRKGIRATTKKSTLSSFKHDNMSLKSGFNIQVFLERPCVQRELPHHADQFCGRFLLKAIIVIVAVQGMLSN